MPEMLDAEIWTIIQTREGSAVLLRPRNKNTIVPIFAGQLEIQSIIIGRDGLELPRPLTHDLFLSLLHSQNLALDRVEIHDLRENIFHARLVISGGTYTAENPLILDSRPSDAFALAARRKCPILVSSEIVTQTGTPLEFFIDALTKNDGSASREESSPEVSPFANSRRSLLEQLNAAVTLEEYERAAEIRDMLKTMDETDR